MTKAVKDSALSGVGCAGPRANLKSLHESCGTVESLQVWAESARISALLGSCPLSHKSFLSGLKCWIAFANSTLGLTSNELPPTLNGLISWSVLFRSPRTYQNYVAHVKLGCQLVGVSTAVFEDSSIKRAVMAIGKRDEFRPRPKLFLQIARVRELLDLHDQHSSFTKEVCMLFLTTYIFLLRLPSEALPIVFKRARPRSYEKGQAYVWVEGDRIWLQLGRRKNKPLGSTMWRECWCRSCNKTCPIHVLGAFLTGLEEGTVPFKEITAAAAHGISRHILDVLVVDKQICTEAMILDGVMPGTSRKMVRP
jgi:hypothetical protein